MRTLALLAALLFASQAWAQPLKESADQLPAQNQPLVEDLLGAEAKDVAIDFTGEQDLARAAPGWQRLKKCQCRRAPFCNFLERSAGNCGPGYKRCCR